MAVATGSNHTCVLLESRRIRCFGFGGLGALGYGNMETIGDDELPDSVGTVMVGGLVSQLVTGTNHTCVLLQDGGVRCFGVNRAEGVLGQGNTNLSVGAAELPTAVGPIAIGAEVDRLVVGNAHSCAQLSDGGVRCWGSGAAGRLGYGNTLTIGDDETPACVGNVELGASSQRF